MTNFYPILRAWIGQKTTIHGLSILVGTTVLLATRQMNIDIATGLYSLALTMILLPEAAVQVKQTEPIVIAPVQPNSTTSTGIPVAVIGDKP